MTLKITAENKIIDIPDLNRFQIGDEVIVDASDVNDRFEGVIIGIEMRRIYGSSVLTPCITLLHDGYITDEFKPIDCRKVAPPALTHNENTWRPWKDMPIGDQRFIVREVCGDGGQTALAYWTGKVFAYAPVSDDPVEVPFKVTGQRTPVPQHEVVVNLLRWEAHGEGYRGCGPIIYDVYPATNGGGWWAALCMAGYLPYRERLPTPEAAKEAAQHDYELRIRDGIGAPPPLPKLVAGEKLEKRPVAFEILDTEEGTYLTRSEQAAINSEYEYHGLYRRDGGAPEPVSVGSSDLIESGKMARTRLMNYANAVQRGEVQGGGREFERRVWGAFSDFDQACDAVAANSPAPAALTATADTQNPLPPKNGEIGETSPAPAELSMGGKFGLGARVRKTKGSSWQGRIVGFYSTDLTPIGYAVESEREPGSVQIYPEAALAKLEEQP